MAVLNKHISLRRSTTSRPKLRRRSWDEDNEKRYTLATEAYFPPDPTARCAILTGSRGKGKSAVAHHWQRVIRLTNRARGIGWKSFANVEVIGADECAEDIFRKIQMDKTRFYHYSTTWLDELPEIMNSKRSMSRDVVAMEAQLRQMRKDWQDVLGTAQYPHELTTSILRQTDFLCIPRLTIRGVRNPQNGQWRKTASAATAMWNWNGSLTDKPHFGKPWPPPWESADQYRIDLGIERTWDYYKTESKVTNIHTEIGKAALADEEARRDVASEVMEMFGDRKTMPIREYVERSYERGAETPEDIEFWMSALGLMVSETPTGDQIVHRPDHLAEELKTAEERQRELIEQFGEVRI